MTVSIMFSMTKTRLNIVFTNLIVSYFAKKSQLLAYKSIVNNFAVSERF